MLNSTSFRKTMKNKNKNKGGEKRKRTNEEEKEEEDICVTGEIGIKAMQNIENKEIISPIHPIFEKKYGTFMFFFKQLLMQPFIRRLFVQKYYPEIVNQNRYCFIKIKYQDTRNTDIIHYIRNIKNDKQDFIIDLAQQDSHGTGHYTSLKRIDGKIEYMDSDPFFYGADAESNPSLYNLIKPIPNPKNIYGSINKNKSKLGAEKSIQNLHKFDTFCQSWSLLFITLNDISDEYKDIYKKLDFQVKTPLLHTDEDGTITNFPKLINNFVFILGFWVDLIQSTEIELNEATSQSLQFKNWTANSIIKRLQEIGNYVTAKNITQSKYETNITCYYRDTISDFTQSPTVTQSMNSMKTHRKLTKKQKTQRPLVSTQKRSRK